MQPGGPGRVPVLWGSGQPLEASSPTDVVRKSVPLVFSDIAGCAQGTVDFGDRGWGELVDATIRRSALLARYRGTEIDTAAMGSSRPSMGRERSGARANRRSRSSARDEVRVGVYTGEVETINGKVGWMAVSIGRQSPGPLHRRRLLPAGRGRPVQWFGRSPPTSSCDNEGGKGSTMQHLARLEM